MLNNNYFIKNNKTAKDLGQSLSGNTANLCGYLYEYFRDCVFLNLQNIIPTINISLTISVVF